MRRRGVPVRRFVAGHRASVLVGLVIALVAVVAIAHSTGSRPRTVAAGRCRAVQKDFNGVDDYTDSFLWHGVDYWNLGDSAKPVRLGPVVTTVGCSIAELTENTGNRVAPGPWPDRTATGLASGTAVFAIRGVGSECRLAVPIDGVTKIYVAIDEHTVEPKPGC